MTHYLCALFGHRYRPRYDSRPSERPMNANGYLSETEVLALLDANTVKTYRGDVCERCGAVANSKEQQP